MDKTITEETGIRSKRRVRSGGRSANTARRGKELLSKVPGDCLLTMIHLLSLF